jgi:hypothetical protein
MPVIISCGSTDNESGNSILLLLCVPGFPLVCSEQKTIKKKHEIYYFSQYIVRDMNLKMMQ